MPDRFCLVCGKPLVQRSREQSRKFDQRVTCGQTCRAHLGHKRLAERAMRVHGITEDELTRRAAAGLCSCGDPVSVNGRHRRKTCGKHECRGFSAAKASDDYAAGERVLPWPVVTGPVEADFSQHEVAAKDGGYGFKILKADARSYTGCSAAYAAGVA